MDKCLFFIRFLLESFDDRPIPADEHFRSLFTSGYGQEELTHRDVQSRD